MTPSMTTNSNRPCTAQDDRLTVESITVTVQNHEHVTDQGPSYRNHAAVCLVVPGENSIQLSIDLDSPDDTLGFLKATYCFHTISHASIMGFDLGVRPGLHICDVANLLFANSRDRYRFTPSVTGCRVDGSPLVSSFRKGNSVLVGTYAIFHTIWCASQ